MMKNAFESTFLGQWQVLHISDLPENWYIGIGISFQTISWIPEVNFQITAQWL
jgi:hypothetical protein